MSTPQQCVDRPSQSRREGTSPGAAGCRLPVPGCEEADYFLPIGSDLELVNMGAVLLQMEPLALDSSSSSTATIQNDHRVIWNLPSERALNLAPH